MKVDIIIPNCVTTTAILDEAGRSGPPPVKITGVQLLY